MFINELRQNVGSVNMIKRGDQASDCLTKIYERSH